jgi:integrase
MNDHRCRMAEKEVETNFHPKQYPRTLRLTAQAPGNFARSEVSTIIQISCRAGLATLSTMKALGRQDSVILPSGGTKDGIGILTKEPQTRLLAVSGLRLGEAISLQPQDVDWSEGVLTVRGKFGKTRLVPLHPSTLAVLRNYAELRDRIFDGRILPTFLVTSRGTKLEKTNLSRIFRELSRQIGIRKPGEGNGPRLHDFRHRFAIETLLRWYRRSDSVPHRMPVLSTYLGHVNVSGTYWYLSSTPALLAAASKRIETRWKGAVR